MITRFGLLTRNPGLPVADFRRHWLTTHGPLAAKMPGLRAYTQNHITESAQRGITYARGNWSLDGFSQLRFDSRESMKAAIASPAYAPVAEDSPAIIAETRVIVADPQVIVPLAADAGPVIKRMSIITRLPGISDADFRREWLETHGTLLRAFPGLAGYTQNHILGRELEPGVPATQAELPVDGIVEMWFRDEATLQAAFASPAGQKAMAHAATFLGEITTYLVEPHRIV